MSKIITVDGRKVSFFYSNVVRLFVPRYKHIQTGQVSRYNYKRQFFPGIRTLNITGYFQHICIIAGRNIDFGEELTYDYKFDRELGEERILCGCQAPNCRGYMN